MKQATSRAKTSRSNIRWADGRYDRLPRLAADLVQPQRGRDCYARHAGVRSRPRRQPRPATDRLRLSAMIRSSSASSPASIGRAATRQVSIFSSAELAAKRLGLLRELVPAATRVAVLVNPTDAARAETTLERRGDGCARHRAGNPCPQRQHQRARSMQPSLPLCASGRMPSSSAPTRSSTAGGYNWPTWRRATQFPRHLRACICRSRRADELRS